jgi:hypothetical protein
MSNRKPTPKARFPNGLGWRARLRHHRLANRTFLNAFLESSGLHRSPRQLRFAVVFKQLMSI